MFTQTLDDAEVEALRRLQGEFRPSGFDLGFKRLMGVVYAVPGASLAGAAYTGQLAFAGRPRTLSGALLGTIMTFSGVYMLWTSGRWYRFNVGQIQKLTSAGKVLWEEDLAGLLRVDRRSSRYGTFLTLRWERQKRTIELFDSLSDALAKAQGQTDDSDEDFDGTSDAEAPVTGPVWKCPACGEENPGNFQVCWKCEKEKEGAVASLRGTS